MSPAQMASISGMISLPWIVKPLWGIISDSIPLFGYRRKSYLIILNIVGLLCWMHLGYN
jgi:hypothetical protein